MSGCAAGCVSLDLPRDLPVQAIAAVGSIFEFANKNPIFGVVGPDSMFYTPILGFFAVTGLPTAGTGILSARPTQAGRVPMQRLVPPAVGFLFFKAVTKANEDAERMDRMDMQ